MEPAHRIDAPGAITRAPGLMRSAVASAVSAAGAVGLAIAARSVVSQQPLSIDAAVGAAVMAVGTLAAAGLALGCGLLAISALARLAGRSARRAEALATLLTPLVVRRALAVTLSAGLGLGLAVPAGAAEPDLGWTVTTDTATSPEESPAPTPVGVSTPGTASPDSRPPAPATSEAIVSEASSASGPGPDLSGAWSPTVHPEAPSTSQVGQGDGGDLATSDELAAPALVPTARPTPPSTADPLGDGPTGDLTDPLTGVTVATVAGEPNGGATPTTGAPTVRSRDRAAGPVTGPVAPPHSVAEPASVAPTSLPPSTTVTVAPGDTLWSIAAAHLGADASRQEIAASWPGWYDVNRATIGADPDRIRPGTELAVPVVESASGDVQSSPRASS